MKKSPLVTNYDSDSITSVDIELHIEKLFKIGKLSKVDYTKNKVPKPIEVNLNKFYTLKPNEYVLVQVKEEIDIPEDLMALLVRDSSTFRVGLNVLSGRLTPGYKGKPYLGLKNESENNIIIRKGMRIAKAVFFEVKGSAKPLIYHYMDQSRVI